MTPWPLDQPIPAVCTVPDVLRILQISRRTFERAMVKHRLPLVELQAIDSRRRFTGDSVARIQRGRWTPQARTA